MVLVIMAVVGGAGLALLTGRRPPAGIRPPVATLVLLAAGVGCETVGGRWLGAIVAGYLLLIGAAVLERRRAGMVLVVVGLLANMTVVVTDGGMPVKGLPAGAGGRPAHHALAAGDHLAGLADVINIPVVSEISSPGDVAISLGAGVAMFGWLRPPARPRRQVATPR
ncbi:MAG: DUF5317 family protein [Acidimicrobiales bacterium]|nr:DUF5317 family protein [Acidimicrobiales bacterium]